MAGEADMHTRTQTGAERREMHGVPGSESCRSFKAIAGCQRSVKPV